MNSEHFRQTDLRGKVALVLATWFGFGLLPIVPGTFGTLGAVPLAVAVHYCPLPFRIVFLVFFLGTAVWASGHAESILAIPDPGEVVIDEVTGFLVSTLLLRPSWTDFALAFFLFRVFDILKPFPAGLFDRKLHGGLGIVMDDVAAGCYTLLAVKIILAFFR